MSKRRWLVDSMHIAGAAPNKNDPRVDLDTLRRAEPKVPEKPDALALEEARNNHARELQRMQRGIIGWCVGSGSEKPGNVATLCIAACFLLILSAFLKLDIQKDSEFFLKILSASTGMIGLALGYLFGSRGSEK